MLVVDPLRLVVVLVLVYGRSGSLSRSSKIGCKILVLVDVLLRMVESLVHVYHQLRSVVGLVLFVGLLRW